MTEKQLDHLQALADAATPGPWSTVESPWRHSATATWVVAGLGDPHGAEMICDGPEIEEWDAERNHPDYSQSDANLAFIAASRTAVPDLIAEVRHLRALLGSGVT